MNRPAPASRAEIEVHVALVAVQVMFASLSVVAKIALKELPPFSLIAARAILATTILCVAHSLRGWQRVAWRDLPTLFVYAFFGIIANQLIFIAGLERSTATNAVVIGATIPVFTVGVALVLKRERATAARLIGLLVAFAGAMAIVGAGRFEAGGTRLLGNLLIVCNSLSFSIYLVISRPLLARYSTLTVITWTFIFGAIGVIPFGAKGLIEHAPALHATTWLAVAYIAIFPTVGTYFLNSYALKRAPSSLVAIYIYLQPVMGALMAAKWLHETSTIATLIGGLLIGFGIALVNWSARRAA
ncbi:MAG TPA: DMT family transporter [Polyangia bacterium]|nr:DMT family transporter [Polyangia bacterium]